jgi:hypothetical protein
MRFSILIVFGCLGFGQKPSDYWNCEYHEWEAQQTINGLAEVNHTSEGHIIIFIQHEDESKA